MIVLRLILLAGCLYSCSALQTAGISESKRNGIPPASRRADSGKYLRTSDLELGARTVFSGGSRDCLNSSQAVSEYLSHHLAGKNANSLLVILVDENQMALSLEDLCALTDFSVETGVNMITKRISELQATSVILVQYQPSRSTSPFNRDREVARSIQNAFQESNISLLDYLIVSRKQCFSFANHRWL